MPVNDPTNVPDGRWQYIQPYYSSGEINPAFLALSPVQKLAHYYSRLPGYNKNPLMTLQYAEEAKRQSLLPRDHSNNEYTLLDLENNPILKEWGVTTQNLRGTPNYNMPSYAMPVSIDEVITDNQPKQQVDTPVSEPQNTTSATPIVTTTPTTAADTDIAIKTPVYDRPDYTKGKSLLSLDELAKAIIAGEFDNGVKRKQRLMNAGYTADEIAKAQQLVNKSMPKIKSNKPNKSIDAVISSSMPDVVTAYQRGVTTPNVSSGYATGHEAYYDPVKGQLRFR